MSPFQQAQMFSLMDANIHNIAIEGVFDDCQDLVKAVSNDLAFKNRNTQEAWPEGSWAAPGDFVRVPKYGGDKWTVKIDDDQEVIFVILNDLDLIGKVTGDPLAMKSFV